MVTKILLSASILIWGMVAVMVISGWFLPEAILAMALIALMFSVITYEVDAVWGLFRSVTADWPSLATVIKRVSAGLSTIPGGITLLMCIGVIADVSQVGLIRSFALDGLVVFKALFVTVELAIIYYLSNLFVGKIPNS